MEKFLESLKKVAKLYTWNEELGYIRGTRKDRDYCPITAVSCAASEIWIPCWRAEHPAIFEVVGLSEVEASAVRKASDGMGELELKKQIRGIVGL